MSRGKRVRQIRQWHRYLGLFIGVQFLFWTISGFYFSWTNLDRIHGDHYKNLDYESPSYHSLFTISDIDIADGIKSVELRTIGDNPYYWINGEHLYNATTGEKKNLISQEEAISVATAHMKSGLLPISVDLIENVNAHSEYRGKPLPAYVITYDTKDVLKSYVSARDGKFQTVRHRSWRWFDFLWMTHVMDYQTRDNINTWILRIFSLMGVITVLSGFLLWAVTTRRMRTGFK